MHYYVYCRIFPSKNFSTSANCLLRNGTGENFIYRTWKHCIALNIFDSQSEQQQKFIFDRHYIKKINYDEPYKFFRKINLKKELSTLSTKTSNERLSTDRLETTYTETSIQRFKGELLLIHIIQCKKNNTNPIITDIELSSFIYLPI